ncbi:DUF2142 domain-containing protein [Actinomyces israelii]|uniref:DUF2142 domain-containing protein n=1 Tax=Actinomyces israelii TaxID=1659 RepID=UPI00235351AB|nr:DUF2142 domain-containing protein [Actinomyces israelii]
MPTRAQDEPSGATAQHSPLERENVAPPALSTGTHDKEGEARRAVQHGMLRKLLLPWNLFTALGLLFGVVFITLIPPGYNPDEPHQFFRALQIANGEVIGYPVDHDQFSDMVDRPAEKVGGEVPVSAALMIRESHVYPIKGRLGGLGRVGTIDWNRMFSIRTNAEVDGDGAIAVGLSNVEVYSPLVYAPTIMSYWIGKAFNLPIAVVFYMARLFDLGVAVVITRAAIRLLPRGKWVLSLLAMMPTTIIQSAAVSADAVTMSMAFLCISLTLRAALQPCAVSTKQWAWIAAAFALLGLAKPSYIVLLGLLVTIPVMNPRARNRHSLILWGIVAVVGAVFAIGWQRATSWVPPSFETIEQVHAQSAFVASHPLRFFKTLIYTFFTDWGDHRFFLQSFVGSASWNGCFLATLFTYSMWGALALSPLIRDENELRWHGTICQRRIYSIGMLTLFTISCAILAFGLYIMWAPPESSVVTGLQGRYFVPIAPVFFLGLMPLKTRATDIQRWMRRAVITIALACLVEMSIQVWVYEWTDLSILAG